MTQPGVDLTCLTPHELLALASGSDPGESGARQAHLANCSDCRTALGLLQQSIGSGRRVPEELAIVGYDDIEFAAAAAVPLTSVRQPRQELGQTAAELVMGKATGVAVAIVRGVNPEWLREGSVKAEVIRRPDEDLFR